MNIGDVVTINQPSLGELYGAPATIIDIAAQVFPPDPPLGSIMLKLSLNSDPNEVLGLFATQVTA